MIPILILAAGTSSRMRGGDKLLEEVRGEPLLRLQAQRALRTGYQVYIALGPDSHARAVVLSDLDVTCLTIPEATEGMSGTMRGAVAKLPAAPAFMMLLGDLVALETEDLKRVFKAREDQPDHLIWRGATTGGKPGHPIIFDASLRPEFAKLAGDSGGETLVKPLREQTCLVPFHDDRARLDLDTPEEWAAWRASLAKK
ncbi:nucleotidyltransferase family protein [Cognatiyoonia sp. IB215182]|uniref:nucleotidyltransferase family protein n=1 Tax=Cognatiyoonia sp. IB215182 TaxID=3097353 RepID=UPI002A158BD4|nr:nucleotidyltransferase family protein [Cognatiyoonia sp. IB215182]MDX8353621.1 nucleotidyltransferase family protein [Cognatiyoonia sp. IB215182]